MGFAGRNPGMLIAALGMLSVMQIARSEEIASRQRTAPPPDEPRRAPAPAGGRTYKATGKRQAARRLRQMERIAAKRSALNPKGD